MDGFDRTFGLWGSVYVRFDCTSPFSQAPTKDRSATSQLSSCTPPAAMESGARSLVESVPGDDVESGSRPLVESVPGDGVESRARSRSPVWVPEAPPERASVPATPPPVGRAGPALVNVTCAVTTTTVTLTISMEPPMIFMEPTQVTLV